MSNLPIPISEQIWTMKYRLKTADGVPLEQSVEETWWRVAQALAAPEAEPELWARRFHGALSGYRFLPAGRVMAGAGTDWKVSLFSSFVMGTIPDTMEGIWQRQAEAALTMQQGGGIGQDFSTIRPKGATVHGVGAGAVGPLVFMDSWDAMCRTIVSAGSRRGAMMATLRCDHPDIEAFIAAKSDPARLRQFNLSVLVTDAFMAAVKAAQPWDLVYGGKVWKTIPARELWAQIMRATYDYAEPGVIFIDRINQANNLRYAETISATNPCGEQPLPPNGACLLGAVNLAALVRRPFSEDAQIDAGELDRLVYLAVRMMDNALDVSALPLAAQRAEVAAKRRIGLGITGLADALVMLGLRYGSAEAVCQTGRWMEAVQQAAYRCSINLAREKGAFPAFEREPHLEGEHVRALPAELRAGIARYGLRNAVLMSLAPTGTTSLFAGNISSGIEPIFATSFTRKVLQPDGSTLEEEVVDHAVRIWRERTGRREMPPGLVTAQELAPLEHVKMQAMAQRYTDGSISKTINCPEDISFEAFEEVYHAAFDQGCKGCTTYRPNPVTGSVLSVSEPAQETEHAEAA